MFCTTFRSLTTSRSLIGVQAGPNLVDVSLYCCSETLTRTKWELRVLDHALHGCSQTSFVAEGIAIIEQARGFAGRK